MKFVQLLKFSLTYLKALKCSGEENYFRIRRLGVKSVLETVLIYRLSMGYLTDSGSFLDRITSYTLYFSVFMQAKYRVMKITSPVSKFKDKLVPFADFLYTHARCPWAHFAGSSYQTHIRFPDNVRKYVVKSDVSMLLIKK